MSISNENKDKRPIKGKDYVFLEINHEPCERDKVYEDYEIISIRKNRFETGWSGEKIQLYKLIIEKDGIESKLELGSRDSKRLAYYTNRYYHNTPDKIDLPKVVSFAWIERETKGGNTYLTLEIFWNYYD